MVRRNYGETYQVLKDTLVQLPLRRSALPQLVVVVLQASPVAAELLEARLVDVVDNAAGAARDPPSLLQTLELALARVFVLALHVVIVVVLAPSADKERRRQQRGRAGADFFDFRDRIRQRGCVVEDFLIEAEREC